jgi:hypothetical protein
MRSRFEYPFSNTATPCHTEEVALKLEPLIETIIKSIPRPCSAKKARGWSWRNVTTLKFID